MTIPEPVQRLQALLRVPTVSHRDPHDQDEETAARFRGELERLFPRLHARLEQVPVPGGALLFRWAGRSQDRPVVLMAHSDVVPVEEGWRHPPFDAVVDEEAVLWGRGTLDDKGSLAGICEAVEMLLTEDFVPAQDVWLSFGCDEEVSGTTAQAAVRVLRERGVRPWFVLDEGGAVAHEAFPGVKVPVAVVGVTEKGVTSVRLTVRGKGGHASTPARMGPTARLARAVLRIERSPFRASTPDPTVELMRRLAPHAPAPLRPVMANAERLRPLLTRALVAAGPESAAMTRTTAAVTTLSGSPALNVIAATATAGVNLRIMVGDTVDGVVEHLRRAVADDEVEIDLVERSEPSPVSPYRDDEAFSLLEETIGRVFPDAVPSPYVMMAATDSRHFTEICDRVYRFAPFRMTRAQRESIHAVDERIGVQDYLDGVDWYRTLLERVGR